MLFRSNDTATTDIYTDVDTLSLHDALPICGAEHSTKGPGSKMRVPCFVRFKGSERTVSDALVIWLPKTGVFAKDQSCRN